MKKILSSLLIIVISFVLISCNNGEQNPKEIVLPSLVRMNESQIVEELSGLSLEYEFIEEMAFNIGEGLFVRYGDELRPGSVVESGSQIKIYISVHKNFLPDLTGLNEQEIYTALNLLRISGVDVHYEESTTVEPGGFIRYRGSLKAGSEVPLDSEVTVYIALESSDNYSLYISRYIEGYDSDQLIEIYNSSNNQIDLSKYSIDLYHDRSMTKSESVILEGTLGPKETFIIVNSESSETLKEKADLISNKLNLYGNFTVVTLSFIDGRVIDVIGEIGLMLNIENRQLVRKEKISHASKKFNILDWDQYIPEYFDKVGVYPLTHPSEFRFNEEHRSLDYFTEPKGVASVSHVNSVDGDTSYFTPGFLGDDRVRYIGIDTREMGSSGTDGILATQAKNFLNNLLNNASEILVQWDPVYGQVDTYNRHLGLIWADGILVNYIMVYNGFSENQYSDLEYNLIYDGISLHHWFQFAEEHAKENNLGVWQYKWD